MIWRFAAWLLCLACTKVYADQYADLCRQAAVLIQNKQYDLALARYQSALAIKPGAPEALNNIAVVYYETGRYSDAFHAANSLWPGHPDLKSAALIAGMSAVRCNRPHDAIAPLKHLLGSDPHNHDALLALASANLALHDLTAAADIYQTDTQDFPNDATGWYGQALCYEQLAEHASRTLSQMRGGSTYSKRLLAEYLQSSGDSKLAEEAFGDVQASAAAGSVQAEQMYDRARNWADKSRAAFERLVTVAPDSWESAVFLGDVARQHNDLTGAITHYQKATSLEPNNPAPLLGLGTAYWELGDFDHAASYLKQTLALNPDANQAVFELANIAVRKHEDVEAIPLLKRYLAAQPDAGAAHADLGRAYLHLQKYQEAVPELTKALTADDRGDIHYQLSLALRKLGRSTEADAALKESTALREKQLERDQRLHSTP